MTQINMETNERHDVKETPISLTSYGHSFQFSIVLPRYIHEALTRDDWEDSARELRTLAGSYMRNAVLAGDYFYPWCTRDVQAKIEASMRDLLNRKFQARQTLAGNLEWATPSLLCGEQYK